jgi:Ca-activated chloride channel family protein
LGKEEDLVEVYQTLDKITPDKVKREIYRPQRDFFWIPLAVALLVFTLYHCLALLIAMLRSPRREPAPERATIAEVSHGN